MWPSRIPLALAILIWGWFVLSGIGLMADVAARHVPGYPNAGQRMLYVWLPLIMCGVSVATLIAAIRLRWGASVGCLGVLLLAALLPFVVVYGGGV